MTYFDDKEKVLEYINMSKGTDGKALIKILRGYLKEGSSVLELGMGPGKDLDILKTWYEVCGSDHSQVFLDLYQEQNPQTKLLLLDANHLDTQDTFDCIYSNKVLQHLSKSDLRDSIIRQDQVLKDQGLLFHTFWKGNSEEVFEGLKFVYYEKKELISIFEDTFTILDIAYYSEEAPSDSIYIILEKK